jgi:flagellin-like protein
VGATRPQHRTGVSELMAAVVTIAITLVAGAALFGYVNGQAATSESNLGEANARNLNFLNEKFVVVDMAIQSGSGTANIWIYNNGNLALQLREIALYDGSKSSFYLVFNNSEISSGPGCVGFGSATPFIFGSAGTPIQNESAPLEITLTLPPGCQFSPSTTYYANVVGLYGNVVVYPECDNFEGCSS